FNELMSVIHKRVYCQEHNIDYETFVSDYEAPVICEEKILGKDAADNFWYCYVLVIIIFMVIIMYGVMIATSVTTEKSNRSIEVLVTSIDSKYLLFGKVFAGATAVVVQLTLILGAALIGYGMNHEAWGDKLDILLDIPGNVLAAFAVFGIGGFLFYAFLYGAMGALVSKTEDINKSAGTLQMVIMIVYFAVLFQLENPDGIIMKVCSFLPFSSYSAMFVRIGMGKVELWEVCISAVVLFISIFFIGWLAAKIYRMGTLRYGNPIKFSKALKDMKQTE
ncbi:MAG: ABC transporter permease, partial [Lachnospiraceae bacterium]|nr:ABC transporter permease [Lachnospiraceae bacterium]